MNMRTRFGTVTLVPSHKHGFDAKQANKIDRNISEIIEQYIPSQVPGDFLIDIDSFHIYPARFAILRFNNFDKWTEYADHNNILMRLREMDGIIRLRLGDMLSIIIGDYNIRVWNYLDRNGNTLNVNVSTVEVRIPFNVSDALNYAGLKRQEFESAVKTIVEDDVPRFPIGILAFKEKQGSPSQALSVVPHDQDDQDDQLNVGDFDFSEVDLSVPKPQGRRTPNAVRRLTKPSLKTGTQD